MLRCSSAALAKNTVAAAIARPARTRCLREHRERRQSSVANVSTVGARGSKRADIEKNEYVTVLVRAPAPSTAVKNRLGYRTRNGKFKRLETHFQLSATGSDSKEVMQSAVALPHSRECTKEATPVLPNNGSKVKFGATAELRNIVQEKKRGKGASGCRFDCLQNFVLWAM